LGPAENLTVISGPLFHQMGQSLNKKAGDKLANGGFDYRPSLVSRYTRGSWVVTVWCLKS
jgi:hypothetical protein